MRIAISPDEDPGDPGSVAADGTTERSVNLRVAGALQTVLLRCGQDAWFDPSLTFQDRVARANSDGTQLLVATAHNASTPGLSGTQFVFCPGGQTFGRQAAAADAIEVELHTLPGWPARLSDAVENIYECCVFNGDTVYAELLFMSPQDEVLWSRPDYGPVVAEAITRGLAATYGFAYVPPPVQPPQEDDMFTDADRAALASKISVIVLEPPGGAGPSELWVPGPHAETMFNVVGQAAGSTIHIIAYQPDGTPISGQDLALPGNTPGVKGPAEFSSTASSLGATGPCILYFANNGPGRVVVTIH